jgi:hypothetical protein
LKAKRLRRFAVNKCVSLKFHYVRGGTIYPENFIF